MTIEQCELHSEVVYEIEQYKLRHKVAIAQPYPAAYHRLNLHRLNLLRFNVYLGYVNPPLAKWFESFSGYRASN